MEESAWEKEKLATLLDAGKTAISRQRYSFAAVNIASLIIVSAEFNVMFPWVRWPIERFRTDPNRVDSAAFHYLQKFRWYDLTEVSVPLVGVKFSAFDLSVIGSIAMAILALWMYYATRRENHAVRAIAHEGEIAVAQRLWEKAEYLYYGIAHHFVFMAISEARVDAVEHPFPEAHHTLSTDEKRPRVLARAAVKFLLYMPAIAPLIVLFVDFSTLLVPDPIDNKHGILWLVLSPAEQWEVCIRSLVCIGFSTFSYIQCRQCLRFDLNTIEAVDRLQHELVSSERPKRLPAALPS